MDISSPQQFESFPVTDYYFAYLGTTIVLTVKDEVDTISEEEEVFGMRAVVITTVDPAERNVLFVAGMQGVKIVHRIQRKLIPPVGSQHTVPKAR
jgi:hypothetical protein